MTVTVDNSGRHYIYNMSCIDVLNDHVKAGTYKADLIFADPPFNIGQDYDTHNDNMSPIEFADLTYNWLHVSIKMLRNGGILAVHIPDSMVLSVMNVLQNIPNVRRIEWITWHYRFAQHRRGAFIPSKCNCLIYRYGDAQHTFNDLDVMEPSDRASKYNDKRTLDSATPGERTMFDVWTDIPRLVGNAKENESSCV